jgi:hypothetical protein
MPRQIDEVFEGEFLASLYGCCRRELLWLPVRCGPHREAPINLRGPLRLSALVSGGPTNAAIDRPFSNPPCSRIRHRHSLGHQVFELRAYLFRTEELMITLYGFGSAWGLAELSPYVTKTEV